MIAKAPPTIHITLSNRNIGIVLCVFLGVSLSFFGLAYSQNSQGNLTPGGLNTAQGDKTTEGEGHLKTAGEETKTGNTLTANGEPGAAQPHFTMAAQQQKLGLEDLEKVALSQNPVNTFYNTYNDSTSLDSSGGSGFSGGGFSGGGGGGYYGSPTVIQPLPIDDYLKGVREVAGMQPPDYKTMADIHDNENLPPLALREMPLEQMYAEPPQMNPPMLADPMNPTFAGVPPENPMNNPLMNPALSMAGNSAPRANGTANPTASTSGNAHHTPIITVSTTPQQIANIDEKLKLGVIAPVIASEINDTLELIYPFDDPRLTDSDIKPVVLSYNRMTDTDMDFYDSLDATLITRKSPSTYYQEADGEVYEVTNDGDVVSTTPGVYLALENTPIALNNQVKFDTRSDTEVTQSFEIDENPVRAYLIKLFGNLNDVSINQTAFDDSRGYRMEIYFVMVHKAGYKNMMIYVHNNHIIGVKFIDRQDTISSVPVYVQMPDTAARMRSVLSTLDSLETEKAIVETPMPLSQPITVTAEPKLVQPEISEPAIPEIPKPVLTAPVSNLNLTEKPKIITPQTISPDVSIPKDIASSEGSKLLGSKQEFKPNLPATGNTSILNQIESQPVNSRPFMLF